MTRIPLARRLAITALGGVIGVVSMTVASAADPSSNHIDADQVALLVSVAAAAALLGAIATRRWATAILAAILAAASPLAIVIVLVLRWCAAGGCA